MELWDSTSKEFRERGLEIIAEYGEILVKIRYPGLAGSKSFLVLNTENDFIEFLNNRNVRDSITIYKVIEKVKEGLITTEFVKNTLNQLEKPKYADWLVVFPKEKFDRENWHYDDTLKELKETFELYSGKYIQILEDPDYLGEDFIYHAYVPDEDGIVRPGAY